MRPESPWSPPASDTSSTDVTRRFGEEGRELSTGTYLKVPELLRLQQGLSQEHDELLFIVAHQVYELWFKVVLFELEAARERIDADDLFFARHHLQRVHVIEQLLVEQIDVLETMSPQDFLAFRSKLAPASGFQSVQFREIEFLSGLKEPKYMARLDATPEEVTRLRKRLDEPSVDDAFRALIQRRGAPPPLQVFFGRPRPGGPFRPREGLLGPHATLSPPRARPPLLGGGESRKQPGGRGNTGGPGRQ